MRRFLVVAALVVAGLTPRVASAFCGFYVAGSDKPMFNDATQVVLMRAGTRTVLSMRNNYKGPPDAFAMVIPVPTVLKEADVKTLEPDVFDAIDKLGSPRLVEYWEQDPCQDDPPPEEEDKPDDGDESGGAGTAMALEEGKMGVKVEARFTVGEYQILILSATESTGLEAWLHQNNYKIPAGAEPLLRPYVEGGLKWFVAKVDPTKVKFVDGRAQLSPLRFHYDSEQFVLPIRLGLANSQGKQDLIVNILAPDDQRYEVANYNNVTIPTNIRVKQAVRTKFAEFYVALFDATLEKTKNAVVTEYAWQASSCDPCPGGSYGGLPPEAIQVLGGDVISGDTYSMTLTRLHARYDKTVADDLWFRKATPISGGHEEWIRKDELSYGAKQATANSFQGRYIIRHPWTGPIKCTDPKRGEWGGPWPGVKDDGRTKPALNTAFVARDLQLATAVMQVVPELDVKPVMGALATKGAKSGCGCRTTSPSSGALLLLALLLPLRRRRRR